VKTKPHKPVREHRVKPTVKRRVGKVVPAISNESPGPPRPTALAGVPVASSTSSSSSTLPLLLGIALGLSLLAVALAATPPWLLPRQMAGPVDEHREAVMFGGMAIAISIGIGFMIAVLGS
jgi:hypothetical protein